ncbi:Proteasome subunit beta type-4 [Lamellibrachia satsuma]|nr:Proteasome subunit beta type-4 [Lamellibrachia satsuma]
MLPVKHTQYPMVTGSSVIGIQFDGGVMIAADKLGSYGSMARYRNCSRILRVNNATIMGAGGDYADFQFLRDIVEQRVIDEECLDDGFSYTPRSLFSWVTRVLYNRRSRFNPLWNTVLIGGLQDGQPFLGYVDKIGTAYQSPTAASGFGAYVALPMLRDAYEKNNKMSEAEAKTLLENCLRVLYYRDCRAWNKYDIAIVTKDGARLEESKTFSTDWSTAVMVRWV